ncbi:MAG: sigma-70 family RNA polymerase sigma factor [Synoicihabitans sp.]
MVKLTSKYALSPQPNIDDETLVARFQSGDDSVFAEIVDRYRARIYGYVRRLLRDKTDAEEVTQDTFVRAYRNLNRFRGDASLLTWLHRIATNLARNRYWYFFRRRRQDTYSIDAPISENSEHSLIDNLVSEEPDPSEQSAKREFTQTVKTCLDRIDPLFREPLEMRAGKDLRYAEIAKITNVPVGTVKSRIARARRELRAHLSEELPDLRESAGLSEYFAGNHN